MHIKSAVYIFSEGRLIWQGGGRRRRRGGGGGGGDNFLTMANNFLKTQIEFNLWNSGDLLYCFQPGSLYLYFFLYWMTKSSSNYIIIRSFMWGTESKKKEKKTFVGFPISSYAHDDSRFPSFFFLPGFIVMLGMEGRLSPLDQMSFFLLPSRCVPKWSSFGF